MSPAQHGLLQGVRGDLSPRLDIDPQGVVRARDRTRSTQGPFARTMTSTLFSCPQHAQAAPGSRHVSRAEASERTVSRRGSCPHWRRAERLSVLVRARRAVYALMSVKLKRLPAHIWSWKSKASAAMCRALYVVRDALGRSESAGVRRRSSSVPTDAGADKDADGAGEAEADVVWPAARTRRAGGSAETWREESVGRRDGRARARRGSGV